MQRCRNFEEWMEVAAHYLDSWNDMSDLKTLADGTLKQFEIINQAFKLLHKDYPRMDLDLQENTEIQSQTFNEYSVIISVFLIGALLGALGFHVHNKKSKAYEHLPIMNPEVRV